jgi:hypothetical protein
MTNRLLHRGIPVTVLVLGYLLTMHIDASLIVFGSFLLVGPMAALIPPFAVPGLTHPESRFRRILICYVAVSLFWIVLNFFFFSSGLAMNPEVFWDTPLSNAIIYAGIVYFNIPSLQKNGLFGGILSYFSKILGKISGYFATSNGRQNVNSGLFGFPAIPITIKTGILCSLEYS